MSDPYVPECAECEEPIQDAADAVIQSDGVRTVEDNHGDVAYVHTWCKEGSVRR